MADFHLWSKESLVQFAEDVQRALTQKDKRITELETDLKIVKDAWREVVSSDTVHE